MNFSRSVPLIGEDGLARLAACRVTVVGLGGVGGYVVEVLARSGVGTLTLIDGDKVEESNLNRQIAALRSTIGAYKAKALAERVKGINPHCKVWKFFIIFLQEQHKRIVKIEFSRCCFLCNFN